MAAFSIRKSFGHACALWCALFASLVLCGGSLRAQTPLNAFKAFLTNPPPIEEIVFERKMLIALPTFPGVTNMVPAGSFFQLRLQTNAYFLGQMNVMGGTPQMLAGAWDDTDWELSNNQLNLWPDRNAAARKKASGRTRIFDPIIGLGLEERIQLSTLTWSGDTFTAQGRGGAPFEGRIESKTAAGLPKRIVTWATHDPDVQYGVEYEYRASFHSWFPAAIKPFVQKEKAKTGLPFVKMQTLPTRIQEFYIHSLKLGSATSQDYFFPSQFTNYNTLTIIHAKGGIEVFNRQGKLALAPSPPPPANKTPPSFAASPANAPLPAPPSANRASAPPQSPPPSGKWLFAALLFLAIPPLLFLFLKPRAE